jgi:3-keto-disaccharide hydrolase
MKLRAIHALRLRTIGLASYGAFLGSLSVSAYGLVADNCDVDEVPIATPGIATTQAAMTPPSDALVLFDGNNVDQWIGRDGPVQWTVHDGILTVKSGTGDIQTRRSFRDFQLHVEWRIPSDVHGEGQQRGNSGVYLQGRYEIQVLDSYHNRTYADGQAGAVYGQASPLVNAMRKPGDWNVYDLIFTAPRFNADGSLFTAAHVTLLHNGVLIQNNTEIRGDTGLLGKPAYTPSERGPIRLQDHQNVGESVSYRNIWIRELGIPRAAPPMRSTNRDDHQRGRLTVDSPVRDLLGNSAVRSMLERCVPEIVPPSVDELGTTTLRQLQGSINGLTDSKLQLIDQQLAEALASH